jgi:hypothetical protein
MLATPTCVDQLTAGGPLPHSSCGAACARSEAIDAGKQLDETSIVAAVLTTSAGTSTTNIAAGCTRLGLPAQAISIVGEVDAALERKHRIMVEIPSDHYGNPTPGSALGHFILVYGYDGANYHAMNPLGGRLIAISAATLIECERERGLRAVEFMIVLPADAGTPIPQPAPTPTPPAPAPASGLIFVHFNATVQVALANVRAGASTSTAIVRTVRHGQVLAFDAYTYGQGIVDPATHGVDHRWYGLSASNGFQGWIASAEVSGNAPGSHA